MASLHKITLVLMFCLVALGRAEYIKYKDSKQMSQRSMELVQQICATIIEFSGLKKKSNIRPVQDEDAAVSL